MNQIKIAIIDVIGLTYDGSTLEKRGLGGSESAVIRMAQELHNCGFGVTVFNNCIDREASPGIYGGVEYIDLSQIEDKEEYFFDVVIGSRTVAPFLPPEMWNRWSYRVDIHERIRRHAKLKALWLHDTFCAGDEFLEDLVVQGHIDEIFTLSDFHTSYVTTCAHGRKRNFEVLKDKIFMTRNGITQYHTEVDISQKDRNSFVYNASVTKGMIPLVEKIWPQVKERLPEARLTIIGGYYRFRENVEPDEQEKKWRELANDPRNPEKGIEFTGIITQEEIAQRLTKASFMIYPGAFPETFGISTLESLAYNTPLITTNFGALEETAVKQACWLIDYAIEPNSLFPEINTHVQVNKFIDLVVEAYTNRYLHQQKQYKCNIVKDICTWDTVALQWKQHIYKKLGAYLSVEDYRKVSAINARIHEVYGRRFSNPEEVYLPRNKQKKIVVITTAYNAEEWIAKCIESVKTQDYENWKMYVIDDASTDATTDIARLAAAGDDRIRVYTLSDNKGALRNQVETIRNVCSEDDIVMIIDGDDALVNDNQIFHRFNNLYHEGAEFTYGSCWSMVDNIPLISQPYPQSIKSTRNYRRYKFNWGLPYTHLRTFKAGLMLDAPDVEFQNQSGEWYKAGGDGALFYSAIERADPNKVVVVQDIVYLYNDAHPANDYKVHGELQNRNAEDIREKPTPADKFSVIIPTMWRAMDLIPRLLESLVDHPLVGEIIIINNDPDRTPNLQELDDPKIIMLPQEHNIMVNPAWNMGAKIARFDKLCFCNDDIVFDTRLFDKMLSRCNPSMGPHGIIWGKEEYGQPPTTDGFIDFIIWKPGDVIHCFGQLFFVHKDNWVPIDDRFKLYYGDDWVFHHAIKAGKTPWLIYNIGFNSRNSATGLCPDIVPLCEERTRIERELWKDWVLKNPLNEFVEVVEEEVPMPVKKILIAVPTNKYVETETMKAIYDLEVPEGYKTELQFFYGYRIDQIRNLIADWAKRYDYLFSVDSDMVFPPDTLKRLLAHNKDMVSGLYIQRKPGEHILEIYRNGFHVSYGDIRGKGLVEIGGCGFGCVLINSDVIRKIEYPHFHYHVALDHKDTVSEDNYFCNKAREVGFQIFADTSLLVDHVGTVKFQVESDQEHAAYPKQSVVDKALREHLQKISNMDLLPAKHKEFLKKLALDAQPKVIYDVGACVLHWYKPAREIWPKAKIIAFDAMEEVAPLWTSNHVDGIVATLSDVDGKEVEFYSNPWHPGGQSYYKENKEFSPDADIFYDECTLKKRTSRTIDSLVRQCNLPKPDLFKIDVQGAELDILRGAEETLSECKHLIVELQHVEYNKGAPLKNEVIDYLKSKGFDMIEEPFSNNGPDGDYYFYRV